MKDAFQVLDFDDPSSEQLKVVMLQCFVTPIILKSDQVCVSVCACLCVHLQSSLPLMDCVVYLCRDGNF